MYLVRRFVAPADNMTGEQMVKEKITKELNWIHKTFLKLNSFVPISLWHILRVKNWIVNRKHMVWISLFFLFEHTMRFSYFLSNSGQCCYRIQCSIWHWNILCLYITRMKQPRLLIYFFIFHGSPTKLKWRKQNFSISWMVCRWRGLHVSHIY